MWTFSEGYRGFVSCECGHSQSDIGVLSEGGHSQRDIGVLSEGGHSQRDIGVLSEGGHSQRDIGVLSLVRLDSRRGLTIEVMSLVRV